VLESNPNAQGTLCNPAFAGDQLIKKAVGIVLFFAAVFLFGTAFAFGPAIYLAAFRAFISFSHTFASQLFYMPH